MMRTVSVKLPKHLDAKLQRIARQRGVSRSAAIRLAIEAYAARNRMSALELAGDLVGCLKGGPRDLSTNPRHMEGFGE